MSAEAVQLFVTGTDTDVGKTLVAGILSLALGADYWKPIQAGLDSTDTDTVKGLTGGKVTCWPEVYRLDKPMSPHKSAELMGIGIDVDSINCPTNGDLIVEGAGGFLVPLNDQNTVGDLAARLGIPAVVVVRLQLGCINHTLMTLECAKSRGVKVAGLVFTGQDSVFSKSEILRLTELPEFFTIPDIENAYSSEWISSNLTKLRANVIAALENQTL